MAGLKRRVAEAIAGRLGLHVFPRSDAPAWPEEDYVRTLFARLKPDCVFDVGANVGQYGRSLRKLGFTGQILSFEPIPAVFADLERAAAHDDRWHCHPYALGRTSGRRSFNVMASNDFSSFLAPSRAADAEFTTDNVVKETIEVDLRTLDEVYPEMARRHGFANPFLKLDTQGFDLEVLRGGGQSLRHFCAMLSEINLRKLYEGAPDYAASIASFSELGFDVARLFPVHPYLILKLIELNCYSVRRDLVDIDRPI